MVDDTNRNIVLICLDSVRKDFFETAASRTRNLCSIEFDQCRAASSWSSPSHASMISGLLPHQHGVTTHSKSFDSLSKDETIFEFLDGYRTIGISANLFAGKSFNFDKYFDEFIEINKKRRRHPDGLDPLEFTNSSNNTATAYLRYLINCVFHYQSFKSLDNGLISLLNFKFPGEVIPEFYANINSHFFDEGAEGILNLAQQKIESADIPTFILLNLMEGHLPHQPARYLNSSLYDCPWNWSSEEEDVWDLCNAEYDEQYWEWRNQLYRANIDYLDRCISDFITGLSEDTSVIITADHGDNLGTEIDDNLANHKSSLSEGVLHVPLLVYNPSAEIETLENQYFSHLQLPELIRGLCKGTIDDHSREQIQAEVIGLSPGPDPVNNYDDWNRMIRCVYRDSKKYVWDSTGNTAKYQLGSERDNWQEETENPAKIPSWATEVFEVDIIQYKQLAENNKDQVEIDQATKDQLEGLGYV